MESADSTAMLRKCRFKKVVIRVRTILRPTRFVKDALGSYGSFKENHNPPARTELGQILKRATENDERFLVDRRGQPSVIIMSIKDYIKNIAPTPSAYQAIRQDAKSKGAASLSM